MEKHWDFKLDVQNCCKKNKHFNSIPTVDGRNPAPVEK